MFKRPLQIRVFFKARGRSQSKLKTFPFISLIMLMTRLKEPFRHHGRGEDGLREERVRDPFFP